MGHVPLRRDCDGDGSIGGAIVRERARVHESTNLSERVRAGGCVSFALARRAIAEARAAAPQSVPCHCCIDCGKPTQKAAQAPRCEPCRLCHYKARRAASARRKRREDPTFRKKQNRLTKARYHRVKADPERYAQERTRANERRRTERANPAEWVDELAYERQRQREKRATDANWRRRANADARAYYRKRRADPAYLEAFRTARRERYLARAPEHRADRQAKRDELRRLSPHLCAICWQKITGRGPQARYCSDHIDQRVRVNENHASIDAEEFRLFYR